jgi:type VI protein secretion system component VasA
MTSPCTELLHRYERERIDRQTIAREFAQRFPAEAATLGLSSDSAEHPQAIRPLPPLTIAHFDCSNAVSTASSLIPRGTTLLSPRLGHTRCQFRKMVIRIAKYIY